MTNYFRIRQLALSGVVLACVICAIALANADEIDGQKTERKQLTSESGGRDKIVAAIEGLASASGDLIFSNRVSLNNLLDKARSEPQESIHKLLKILNDHNSSLEGRCGAAYYLGQMHAREAIDSLISQITLSMPMSGHLFVDEMVWRDYPAVHALISIGSESVPALVHNLAEVDDGKARNLMLKVLLRIEADKDVVQLRLKKVLDAGKDDTKRARIEAAIKTLSDMPAEVFR
jgi:HEAT repeat protein